MTILSIVKKNTPPSRERGERVNTRLRSEMIRGQQFELVAIAQYAATLYRRAVCRDLNFQKWGIRFSFDKVQNEFNFDFADMYPKMTTMWYISFCNGLYGDALKHYCNGGFDSLYRPQRAGRINLGSRSAFDNLWDTSRRIISPVHHFLLGIENTDDTMMQNSDHVMEFKIRPRLMRVNILHQPHWILSARGRVMQKIFQEKTCLLYDVVPQSIKYANIVAL